jgi:hypothetical protein
MDTYRLRVELADEADAALGVAGAIGGLGGSVVSIDLHEVDGAAAVDEIVVELPGDVDRSTLRAVLEDDSNAALLSSKRCARNEPLDEAVHWARDAGHGLQDRAGALSQQLSVACPLATVRLCDPGDAGSLPAVRMAFERGAPVVHRTSTLPARLAGEELRSPRWVLAVPDRYPEASDVALLTRPISLRFSAGEVARVQLLMAS